MRPLRSATLIKLDMQHYVLLQLLEKLLSGVLAQSYLQVAETSSWQSTR